MIQFDDSYFEEEVRDGFRIVPMMKRVWAAQMEVLMDMDALCRKYGIKYFVNWGTLLGTIRHKGFIPWDDDIDLLILRDDYLKLRKVVNELPDGYELVDVNNDPDYDNIIARIVNSRRIDVSEKRLTKFHNCPYVVGVDINILDYKSPDPEEDALQLEMAAIAFQATSVIDDYEQGKITYEELRAFMDQLAEMCGVTFDYDKPLKQQALMLGEHLSMLFQPEETEEVHGLGYRIRNRPNYYMPKKWFDKAIYMPFEGVIEVPVPEGYDGLLRLAYGDDYMTPNQAWCAHDYPFYKSQEKILAKYLKDNHVSGDFFYIDLSKYE